MAQLDHPSIIPLYGLHCGAESKLHLAMKHIHGKTLQKYLKDIIILYEREGADNFDEKRSISTRIEYLIKVCEAVDYAHSKGVIHRDLKPENIMIGNYGEVYVMDWGLACLLKPEDETDAKDNKEKVELVGTPCYIAPELIAGSSSYSPQSDIFSLGMILFEIVTLTRAVSGKTVSEVLKNIVHSNYSPFKHRFLKAKLPGDLKAIFEKAVCPAPSLRYKSAHDMAEDLKLYLMREETVARPDNIFRKCTRAMINHKLITSLVILCILLCLSASTIYSLSKQNALIKEQKIREAMLASFQSEFAKRAHKMEKIFFYFKTQLANLSHRAGHLLSNPAIPGEHIYSFADFAKASTVPPDFAYSPFYSIKLSLDNAIFIPGPDVKLTDKESRRIFPLQEMFKHYMFTSNPRFRTMTPDAVRKEILDKGAPLSWASLGLKNGTMFSYPGTNNYSKSFDPRKRPWYKNALPHKDEVIWSEPYKCAVSSKMLIPCITCVYNDKKQFQGVASIDLRLDYLKESVFSNKGYSSLKEYLLDQNDNVLLSSDFEDKEAVVDQQKKTLIKKKFLFEDELHEAIEKGLAQFEATRNKTKYIFALYQFPIGYYYIQQVSEQNLRQAWDKK
jgi:serine/threonine-protein kinase